MEPTTLLDNLDSDFLEALSALQPKASPDRVLVYVESDEDIAFWRNILNPFEKNGISFDIQLPIRNAFEKGKVAVLKFKDNVGSHLILCVDSDYDYLLQNTTVTSRLINTNPFIFQTYTYSLENFLCYCESLRALCVQATKNNTQVIDLVALIQLYSEIVYPLFLWSIHFAFKEDTTSFTISNFSNTIKILGEGKVDENFQPQLVNLKQRVNVKIQELENQFANQVLEVGYFKEYLFSLGVGPKNTCFFIQGHTLKDNVILMFLKPIEGVLKKEKREEIKKIEDATIRENAGNQYTNQISKIESVLNNNTEYKSCFLYQKINTDLQNYVNQFYSPNF